MRKSKKIKLQEEIADLRNLIEANRREYEKCICEEIRRLKKEFSEQTLATQKEIEKLQNKVDYLKDYIVFKNKVKKGQKFVVIEECDVFFEEKEPHNAFMDINLLFGNKYCGKKLCVQYLDEFENLKKIYVKKETNNYRIVSIEDNDYLIFSKDCNLAAVFKIDTEMGTIKEIDLDLFLKAHGSKEK